MKKKIIEWLDVLHVLENAKVYPGIAYQVWCSIAIKKINNELDPIRLASEYSDEYKEFQQKLTMLKEELCVKGENGQPVLEDDERGKRYTFTDENKVLFESRANTELDAQRIIDEHVAKTKEYYEYIKNTDLDISIKYLNPDNLPTKFFEENNDKSIEFATYCSDMINFQ